MKKSKKEKNQKDGQGKMLSVAVVESCHLQTEHCISHPLVGLYFDFRSCTHLSKFISTDWLSFQSLWSLCRCLMCRRDVPVCISSLCCLHSVTMHHYALVQRKLKLESTIPQSPYSWVDFACWPFPVQLLVRALYDRFLPHYTPLMSTLCWTMRDALMPSFEWISSHLLQIIYSGIGI